MLKRFKESSRDVAMFALVSSLFFAFKIGTTIYKFRRKFDKKICIHCESEVSNGVDLGDGDCLCINCANKRI